MGKGKTGGGVPLDDLAAVLSLLPVRFGEATVMELMSEFARPKRYGASIWYQLKRRGLVVRTGEARGRRGFFWMRTPGSTPDNEWVVIVPTPRWFDMGLGL